MLNLFLIFVCVCFGFAQDIYQQTPGGSSIGELSADELKNQGDTLEAKGNVVLINGDFYISSDTLTYHQKEQIAEIQGEVKIYKGSVLLLSAKNVRLDFKKEKFSLSSMYLQNPQSGLWVSAGEAQTNRDVYEFESNIVSGCDIQDPIWHIDSSSGSFNQNSHLLTLWNSRIYVGDVPLLYVPYLALSTYNQRKSGLLYPDFALSNQDGLYYRQPIFIAPQQFWDATLALQARSARGIGGDLELNFATPQNNLFSLTGKYFYNFENYVLKNNLKHQHVYGGNAQYSSNTLFDVFNPKIDDGLFLDLTYMNDIDYLRIDHIDKKITERLKVSQINYYLQSQEHYFGLYSRYYFDLSKPKNTETFQQMPNMQYHKYLDSLFWRNLFYYIDVQSYNNVRDEGYNYVQNSIALPIGIEVPLFDNYISVGIATDLNFHNIVFFRQNEILSHLPKAPRTANVFGANYSASVSSDLAKNYTYFLHTLQTKIDFSGPYYHYGTEMFSPQAYEYFENYKGNKKLYNLWNPSSIVDFQSRQHKMGLSFLQYFYTPNGRSIFYYKLSQQFNLQDKELMFVGNPLKNEFGTSPIEGLTLSGAFNYAPYYQVVEEASANLAFSKWTFSFDSGFFFKRLLGVVNGRKQIIDDANFLNFNLRNDFGYFSIGGGMSYDFLHQQVKDWNISLSKDVRCFGVTLKFAQEFVSVLTDRVDHPLEIEKNQYVRLEFRFVPLTSTGMNYRFQRQK
ncbi:hypothetical protein BBW65_00490 [Helicobacter enhydrae]|uniref:Uncharacterized protein n=1 Tax=Helicobacter enhydrae TaxID=222136 RepID=A0A1B1U3R1_9HELI|nr:LPS-assembly protein LptD [Helicobacter enhydrae]ANV97388.1 hypothetical protein BBW65_00490 [Helicobacter enhydrae]